MSILDEREAYLKNPYFKEEDRLIGDFTPFYVGITICTVIGLFLAVVNIAFCYCSPYKYYWRDRHTGNRWIQSLWTVTPHNNPPLDLTELEKGAENYRVDTQETVQYHHLEERVSGLHHQSQQYIELQKRESDI